ncbi:MAG: hypothetical protein WEC75_10520 [Dehalococcoidia bacterium]
MADVRTGTCVHHWVLGIPEDDVIRGRCKRCGAVRDYPASVDGISRQGVYDEAASLNRTVSLLPDAGRDVLPGARNPW